MRTPTWRRHRATELGHHVAAVVDESLGGGALHHLPAAQGVIGLAERHDPERVDVVQWQWSNADPRVARCGR